MAGPLTAVGKILKGVAGLAVIYAAYQAFASAAAIPVLGAGVGAVISASILTAGFGLLSSIKDGEIDPTGKKPILSGDFGSVQLDPKDKAMYGADGTIKVGTNLGGRGNTNNATPQQDNSALIAEIRAMRQEQARSNSKPTVIENSVNGTRFGTAVAMNTYKTA
jgi:hypothetical protein